MNYWKWGGIAVVIIAAMWGGCEYGIRSVVIKQGKSDTAITKREVSIISVPIPIVITKDSLVYWENIIHDTIPIEVSSILNPNDYIHEDSIKDFSFIDWNKTRIYDTTLTSGNDTIRITDNVQYNKITKRVIKAVFTDSIITKTKIITLPRKTVLSAIISMGSTSGFKRFGIGTGLLLKLPNENTYKFEVKKIQQLPIFFEGSIGFPIHLNLFPKIKTN